MARYNTAMTEILRHFDVQLAPGPPGPPGPPGGVEAVALDWPEACGAECVFLGRTRAQTHPQMGPLQYLNYEVYEPMALKLLNAMVADAAERFDARAIRMIHSQGKVAIGEASVVIQVATPHRGASFEACRYLIDRLKQELPVWKQEVWETGQSHPPGTPAPGTPSSPGATA